MNKNFFFSIKSLVAVLLFLQLCSMHQFATAQLSVAPTPIFISDRQNAGSFFISNRGTAAQEVSIETLFGYVVSDSLGSRTVTYDDPFNGADFDLSEMVRIFPRRFTLEGGQQRTIRVQVIPGGETPDGTYMARLLVTSEGAGRDLEELEAERESGELVTRIDYRFVQGFSISYRRGEVNTGLAINDIRHEITEQGVDLFVDKSRTGNSPYIGIVRAQLINGDGEVVANSSSTAGAAFNMIQRITFRMEEPLDRGEYTARLEYISDRTDITPGDIVFADPIIVEHQLSIP